MTTGMSKRKHSTGKYKIVTLAFERSYRSKEGSRIVEGHSKC